jgi:alpha-beta hydrolase superfamily lysophospholipase
MIRKKENPILPAKTIVLIHGLWMTPLSWEHWVERYQATGYTVLAPSWPGLEGDIETIRTDTSAIDHLGVTEIVDHYDAIIRGLDQPPIIMGHSFGGLITQILLDRDLGAAGVAIDSAPVKGILALPRSSIKSSLPALKNPTNVHKSVALSPEEFHYAFTNTLTEEESLAVYERYAVPGPGRVLFQAALANFNPHAATKVDFENDDRAPLLIIAGGADHVSPPAVNEATAKLQRKSEAVTDYKEFPGRSHYILGQEGWEEVADYALDWAAEHAKPA